MKTALNWIKQNKVLAVALLILLLLLPPMLLVAYKAVKAIYDFLLQFGQAGEKVAEAFRSTVASVATFVRASPVVVTAAFIAITFIAPVLGLALLLWRFVDSFKKPVTASDVGLDFESSGADTETDYTQPAILKFPTDFGPTK